MLDLIYLVSSFKKMLFKWNLKMERNYTGMHGEFSPKVLGMFFAFFMCS
jgi:hypothetical protein